MKIKSKSLQTWAKLLPFLAPYKKHMILIVATMLLGAGIDTIQPLFSGYAVDHFIEPGTTEGIVPFILLYVLLVVLMTLSTILMAIFALKVEMYLGRDLKRRLFEHLQTLDFSYYNTTPVGRIMARVMSDTNKIGTVLAWSLVDIFWSAAYVIGCVFVMLAYNWKLALILIAIIPVIAVFTVIFQKKILAVNRRVRAINAEVTRHYNEGISGAKTSKTLVIEDKNDAAFRAVTDDMRRTTIHAVWLNAVYIPIIGFLTAIGVALVLTRGGNMVLFGDISVGDMTVFINYALVIADPVQQLARTISNFIATQANIERVSALMERPALITDTPEVIEKYGTSFEPKRENWEPITGRITFDDVTFRYPDGTENVLEHFSLDIPAGTTVAIVGETGAGKSTLVNLVPRFYDATAGAVRLNGVDVRDMEQAALRAQIGYVPQKGVLFSGTIASNIRYGREDADDKAVLEALDCAQASEFVSELPDGAENPITQGGTNVSGGQKQRLAIARALVRKAPVYIFDDSFSALDFRTDAKLRRALSAFTKDSIVLIVAQRVSTILNAEQIIVLDEGKIVGRGTHRELLETCPTYREIAESQLSKEELA